MNHAASSESVIAKHPFFEGMSPHHVHLLCGSSMPTNFAAGELIFLEGDLANRFYLLQKGRVALETHVQHKGHVCIQTLGAGDVLGWSWLFPPYIWHFSARALEPIEAIFIYGTPLREQCESNHDLGYELMKRMAKLMMKRLQATRWQLLGTPGPENWRSP